MSQLRKLCTLNIFSVLYINYSLVKLCKKEKNLDIVLTLEKVFEKNS